MSLFPQKGALFIMKITTKSYPIINHSDYKKPSCISVSLSDSFINENLDNRYVYGLYKTETLTQMAQGLKTDFGISLSADTVATQALNSINQFINSSVYDINTCCLNLVNSKEYEHILFGYKQSLINLVSCYCSNQGIIDYNDIYEIISTAFQLKNPYQIIRNKLILLGYSYVDAFVKDIKAFVSLLYTRPSCEYTLINQNPELIAMLIPSDSRMVDVLVKRFTDENIRFATVDFKDKKTLTGLISAVY